LVCHCESLSGAAQPCRARLCLSAKISFHVFLCRGDHLIERPRVTVQLFFFTHQGFLRNSSSYLSSGPSWLVLKAIVVLRQAILLHCCSLWGVQKRRSASILSLTLHHQQAHVRRRFTMGVQKGLTTGTNKSLFFCPRLAIATKGLLGE